jgi:DNA-binding NarL/FixJ family response regulator
MITVLLVDDHSIIRQGLKALLEREGDFTVVYDTQDGAAAIEAAERLCPGIAVVDMMMPDTDGVEVTTRLREVSPDTKILILSMCGDEKEVKRALNAGASGYILKETTMDLLVHAVRQLVAGSMYLGPGILENAVAAYLGTSTRSHGEPVAQLSVDSLTRREVEVLQLIAQGCTNGTVATQLKISPRTVEVHRANIHRKLGVHSQAEIIRYAIKQNLVTI